jgi:uncharacterized membrane protein
MSRAFPDRLDRSRLGLAALMTVAGISHFVVPSMYERIVPAWIGHERRVVEVSGIAELLGAGLLASRRTRRLGGWWTAVVLVVVFPANIQMALDGGLPDAGWPANSAAAAWARLPLQLPLIWWAFRQTRSDGPDEVRRRTT